jgi:hypothetical protein
MIIWEGAGALLAPIIFLGLLACFGFSFVDPGQTWTWYASLPVYWFVLFIAGRGITRAAPTWLNEDGSRTFPGKHHTLFFLPIDLWWVIMAALTAAVLFFG